MKKDKEYVLKKVKEREGVGSLSGNLFKAIELAEKSELVRKALEVMFLISLLRIRR